MWTVLLRRGRGQTDAHTEEKAMSSWWGASSDEATCQPKSEIPGRPQKFRGKHGVDFFYNSQKEPTPMTLSSQTSILQKCNWINVPCCRLPICGTLLWRPQETKKRWFQDSKEEKKVSEPRVQAIFKSLSESHLLLSHRQKESHIWSTRVKE